MTSNIESFSPDHAFAEPITMAPLPSSSEVQAGGINFTAEPSAPITEVDIESPTFTVRIKSPAPLGEVADTARKLFDNHFHPTPSGGGTGFALEPAA